MAAQAFAEASYHVNDLISPLFSNRLSISSGCPPSGVSTNGSDEYFRSANHAEQTFRKMEHYLQQKQLCDVLLIAGDHRIPAHR